jgi:hypothetical protein
MNKIKWIWIPEEILFNDKLNINDKVVFSLIKFLDWDKWCFASTKYLSDMVWIPERTLYRIIDKLFELWFIKKDNFWNKKVLTTFLKVNKKDMSDSDYFTEFNKLWVHEFMYKYPEYEIIKLNQFF